MGKIELLQVWKVVESGRGDGADVVLVEHQPLQRFESVEVVVYDVRNIVRREVQVAQGGKTPQSSLSNVGHLDVGVGKY